MNGMTDRTKTSNYFEERRHSSRFSHLFKPHGRYSLEILPKTVVAPGYRSQCVW